MKKIIALVCIVGCMGMLFGCACDTKKSDETTTPGVSGITNIPADQTTAKPTVKKGVTVTAVPKQKQTKKAEKPTKSKAAGGNIVGSWTFEGGIFVYTFKKDGTGVYTTGSEAMYFNYKTLKNKVRLIYKDGTVVKMPYTVKGNVLILKDENNDDMYYYKNNPKSKPKK